MSARKFIQDSFRNGNRYTNIGITIITALLMIIGFFLKDIYGDFKEMKNLLQKHDTKIEVIDAKLNNHFGN